MPAFKNHNGFPGVPNVANSVAQFDRFAEVLPYFEERNYTFTDISADGTGTPVPSAEMRLFNVGGPVWVQEQFQVSDPVTGAYSFVCDKTQTYVIVGYKAGGPDIEGVTVKQAPV